MQNKVIAVIRNSLSAANAALDLLEQVNNVPAAPVELLLASTVTSTVVEAAPIVVEEPVVEVSNFGDQIHEELRCSDYDLRTMRELCSKFTTTPEQIKLSLNNIGVSYVIKHRRADGAELIGLSSRN